MNRARWRGPARDIGPKLCPSCEGSLKVTNGPFGTGYQCTLCCGTGRADVYRAKVDALLAPRGLPQIDAEAQLAALLAEVQPGRTPQ